MAQCAAHRSNQNTPADATIDHRPRHTAASVCVCVCPACRAAGGLPVVASFLDVFQTFTRPRFPAK
jgi:hypothetical protein